MLISPPPGNTVIDIRKPDLNVYVIDRFQRADGAFCAALAASALAVLAPVHLPIRFQCFVESLVLNQMSFAFRYFIGHN